MDDICTIMQVSRAKDKRGSVGECCVGLAPHLPPKLFKALSDPRRVSLFVRMAELHRPCTVGEIAEGCGVDLSVVSRHLAILREAGVIECDKQGKEVWCSVRANTVVKLLRDLADAIELCCPDGDGRKCACSQHTAK